LKGPLDSIHIKVSETYGNKAQRVFGFDNPLFTFAECVICPDPKPLIEPIVDRCECNL